VRLDIADIVVERQRDQRGQNQIGEDEERDRPEPAAAGDRFAHPAQAGAEAGEQKEERNCEREKLEGRPTNVCVSLLTRSATVAFGTSTGTQENHDKATISGRMVGDPEVIPLEASAAMTCR
jgi:hypothetical protein